MNEETINFSELLDQITELILKEKNTEQKARLRKQHKELSNLFAKIVERNIEQDNTKYAELLNNLQRANKSLKESLKDGRKVVRTIQVMSETLSIIENLLT